MAEQLEVARFPTLPEGELAVAVLRRHGIAAIMPDREAATVNPDLLFALGGVRVTAPSAQISEARGLIAGVRAGKLVDQSEDWRIDETPGRVGELKESEVSGVMTWIRKTAAVVVVLAVLVFPLANCMLIRAAAALH